MVFQAGGARLQEDRPDPRPRRDEALIRVGLAGVCSTDLEVVKGYMGFEGVMGHEFVGEIVHPPQQAGRRVVGEINCPCGTCPTCQAGLSNHCPHRTVIGIAGRDGCFAEYLTLPLRNCHDVPDALSDRQAVFVEPLAAAMQVTCQVTIDESTRAVVLGDGRLAQLIARVLAGRTRSLCMVGKHEPKLRLARRAGVPVTPLGAFTPRKDADVVVDATGSGEGLALAMATVRPRGTIVLKSTAALGAEINLAPLVVDEVTVVGSRCGPFPAALEALAARRVSVDDLVSATWPLSEGLEALADAAGTGRVKVLLDAQR
jgi:threonine dehydrogenase-like Zn-dependent dehydrogenase